jgi:hypothetical protein
MRFRNYCIVVIGQTSGVEAEITKISEGKPNFFDAKGLFIATFSSFLEPYELTEWFTECNRNFMVFDLDHENSGFNITNRAIHDGLFGFIQNINVDEVRDNFFKSLEPQNSEVISSLTNKLNVDKIKNMGETERQNLLNDLIEFGLENLSEEDKKLLPLLAK